MKKLPKKNPVRSPSKRAVPLVNPNNLIKLQIFVSQENAARIRRVAAHTPFESMSQICTIGILNETAKREKLLGKKKLNEAVPLTLRRGRRPTAH